MRHVVVSSNLLIPRCKYDGRGWKLQFPTTLPSPSRAFAVAIPHLLNSSPQWRQSGAPSAMATPSLRTTVLPLLLLLVLLAAPVWSGDVEEKAQVVNDPGVQEKFVEANAKPASFVETSTFFPKNPNKVVKAGEPTQVDVEIKNSGSAALKVAYTRATLHLLHDYSYIVQNFTVQESSLVVPAENKETLKYSFSINKFLQPGAYDLVGHVVYEAEGVVYRTVFHNATIDVAEGGSFVKGETVFLSSLALGLLGLLGMWAYSKVQDFIKKQRRSTKKVETGTRTSSDANTNEWLQGTSITQKLSRSISQQRKSYKKKPSVKEASS